MIPRRSLVTGGVIGSLLGVLAPGDEAAAQGSASGDDARGSAAQISQAIAALRAEVANLRAFGEIAPVREAQVAFLRANGKFPDYIEVGSSVWFGVHDWHIRWQQPLSLGRDSLGRYTLVLNQSVVVMRPDVAPMSVGVPYDNR